MADTNTKRRLSQGADTRPKRGRPDEKGGSTAGKVTPSSKLQETFAGFSKILDTRNERRERIYKASRDVTADSKKIIFQLHRIVQNDKSSILAQAKSMRDKVQNHFEVIKQELQGGDIEDYWRFQRSISFGVHVTFPAVDKEYIESVSFLHYLETGEIISREKLEDDINTPPPTTTTTETAAATTATTTTASTVDTSCHYRLAITVTDYLLGLADLTGELMRYSINCVAAGDRKTPFIVCDVLQRLYDKFQTLPISVLKHGEMEKKMVVMQQSLSKVETVCYGVVVRGSEYPDAMLADTFTSNRGDEHED